MRATKRKKISRKRCLRTMAILLASVMVLSSGSQVVFAKPNSVKTESSAEEPDKTFDESNKREATIVYLDGKKGRNKNSGESPKEAVKTFERAAELVGDYGMIRICGTVTVRKDEIWNLPYHVVVRRAEKFNKPLVRVRGSLVLENVRVCEDDIVVMEEGSVEGAVEKEAVYIPKRMVMSEPTAIGNLPLIRCEGDGEFVWEEEEAVPSEYETEYNVIFRPENTKAVDYSKEEGWNKKTGEVIRKVTIQVTSLKPEVTPTPEATPEPTPEVTPTPEATPEPTPEVTPTPEATPEPTPEVTPTPETTPEPTPEVTPTPETTPEPTPEVTPTPETTPEPTPEVTPIPEEKPETTPSPEPIPGEDDKAPEEVLTEEEKAAAFQVQTLIDYLPTEITSYEEVSAVVDATRQYEELSEAQKALLTEGTDENLAQVQNLAAVYNRQCNGVTIEGDFPWYVQFLVEMKNEETDSSVLVPEKADTFITPYNMKLWDLMKDEEYVLSGQQVKITMPAPDGQIYDKLVIIHYREDGSVEYITPINNPDETISFVTTSFSPYNVAGSRIAGSDSLVGNIDKVYDKPNKPNKKPLVPKNPSGNKKPSNSKKPGYKPSGDSTNNWVPKTGDDQNMLLYAGIAGGALVILAVAFVMKNRKKNSDKTEE